MGPPSEAAKVPAQTAEFFGGGEGDKKVSEMISKDTKIAPSGKVYGTLHNVTGFTKFSKTEADGHFFPLTLTGEPGSKMELKKDGAEDKKKNRSYDKDIILKVEQSQKWEIKVDGVTKLNLDFQTATFEK